MGYKAKKVTTICSQLVWLVELEVGMILLSGFHDFLLHKKILCVFQTPFLCCFKGFCFNDGAGPFSKFALNIVNGDDRGEVFFHGIN